MHDTAMKHGKLFFETYVPDGKGKRIVEIGAQNVNGSLREVAPPEGEYIGVDFVAANGVDVVITDPYTLPFEDNSVDICLSSSCFEHAEFFWLSYLEVMRVLKPDGLFFLNAPSNGMFHRYPVDCWRFYPDSGLALSKWGRRNGHTCLVLESFIGNQEHDMWSDFVTVFLKDESFLNNHHRRILDDYKSFTMGYKHGSTSFMNNVRFPEDLDAHKKLKAMTR